MNDLPAFQHPPVGSIKQAYDRVFNSGLSPTKLRDAALAGRLLSSTSQSPPCCTPGRSVVWKMFLESHEPLETAAATAIRASSSLFLQTLRQARQEYRKLVLEQFRAPDGTYEEGLVIPGTSNMASSQSRKTVDLERNNPLSLDNNNPWTEWFVAIDTRKTIALDVERTFPDVPFFRDPQIQTQLTNILFLYSVTHADIGYRQGMHELLAPLYLAIQFDSLDEMDEVDDTLKELCSRAWVAADAWILYNHIMASVSSWYEWREPDPLPGPPSVPLQPYIAPIVQVCHDIQAVNLRSVDPVLWRSLHATGIEPQIYGIRWLRLLFTREFGLAESMKLWDALFACDPSLKIVPWVCVAMLIRVRNELIPADYSTQLTTLLRYPSFSKIDPSHTTLLLTQAVALQMSPTPSTGHSLVLENKNRLDISTEVSLPPRPLRSRLEAAVSSSRVNPSNMGPNTRSNTKQPLQTQTFPEIFGGILEKGESLGINKTLRSAVSEIRRNIPDLSAFANPNIELPESQGHRPLTNRSDSGGLSPASTWRDASVAQLQDLREMNRQIASSLGWILAALHDDRDEAQKTKALDSLAYIRDAMVGKTQFDPRRLRQSGQPSNDKLTPVARGSDSPSPPTSLAQTYVHAAGQRSSVDSLVSSHGNNNSQSTVKGRIRTIVQEDPLGAM